MNVSSIWNWRIIKPWKFHRNGKGGRGGLGKSMQLSLEIPLNGKNPARPQDVPTPFYPYPISINIHHLLVAILAIFIRPTHNTQWYCLFTDIYHTNRASGCPSVPCPCRSTKLLKPLPQQRSTMVIPRPKSFSCNRV